MHDIIIHKNKSDIIPPAEKCFSILYIIRGSADLSVNKSIVTLTAPVCLCLNEKDKLHIQKKKDLVMTSILFHPDYVNSSFDFGNLDPVGRTLPRSAELDKFYLIPFIDRSGSYKGCFYPDPEQDVLIQRKIKLLITDYEDRESPFLPCRKRSSFLDLLLFLSRNYRGEQVNVDDESLVEKVITFFTDNYQDKITITDLCSRFVTNRNTLAKKFREERGVPVMESLAEIRVRMAASLLMKTQLPVIDILYRVGFNDTAHFGRTFKKFTGVSPSEYRKSGRR